MGKAFLALILLSFSSSWAEVKTPLGSLSVDQVEFPYAWPKTNQTGFGILWWNTYKGTFNPACTSTQDSVFSKNLFEIIRSSIRPKMIILGEYEVGCLEPWLQEELEKKYDLTVSYYDHPDTTMAFAVFVDHDVKKVRSPSYLQTAWYPEKWAEKYQDLWYKQCRSVGKLEDYQTFDRGFPEMDLYIDGKEVTVIPVHMAMPWGCYLGNDTSWWGKVALFGTIMTGKSHPVYYQVESLTRQLQKKIDAKEIDRTIVLGDWNLFRYENSFAMEARPETFKLMDALAFSEDTTIEDGQFSFPAVSFNPEKVDHPMLLDHMFHRGKISPMYTEVLPLQGSDHYPILTYIKVE